MDVLARSLRTILGYFTEAGGAHEARAVPSSLVARCRSALTARRSRPYYPAVAGHCPSCGLSSLFLAEGGYVTCSSLSCQAPDAAATELERGTSSPRRQAAYDAVYDLIHDLGPVLPPDPAHRNAAIWRAVNAALDAAGLPVTADPADPRGDTVPPTVDMVPTAGDTAEDTALATGGHVRVTVPGDGLGCDLTSGVPVRPRAGDTGDTAGGTRPGGVRFTYTARVPRGQIPAALTEAFELLDAELHPTPEADRDE
jgi:hypothetical protein